MSAGLNLAQLQAVHYTDGPCLVLAGAGSGKTRVITHKIAHMIDAGLPAKRIAAITFTNKAAAEMRERAKGLIGRAAKDVLICTFHALGVRMMREDGKVLGLKPQFSILDADDVTGIRRRLGHGVVDGDPRQPRPQLVKALRGCRDGAHPCRELGVPLREQVEQRKQATADAQDQQRARQAELAELRKQAQAARGRLSSLETLQAAALGQEQGAATQWLKAQGLAMIFVGIFTGIALSIIGIPAAPALAAPEPVSDVRVAVDLGAVTNTAAAQRFATLDTDLKNALMTRRFDRICPDGLKIDIDISEVDLSNFYPAAVNAADTRLVG